LKIINHFPDGSWSKYNSVSKRQS